MEEARLGAVDAGQVGCGDELDQGSGAAAEYTVDLVAALHLFERFHRKGVGVVGRHLLEIADAEGDGVHSGGCAEQGVVDDRRHAVADAVVFSVTVMSPSWVSNACDLNSLTFNYHCTERGITESTRRIFPAISSDALALQRHCVI